MTAGLFFGTFNPVHTGHMIIALSVLDGAALDEVWFVISPQNPFKKNDTLVHARHRFEMVRLAVADHPRLRASDIEFYLPVPSYTVDTLAHLSGKFPDIAFKLVLGSDSLVHFHKWKNPEKILQFYEVLVYPRPHGEPESLQPELSEYKHRFMFLPRPRVELSSSDIRNRIKNKMSVRYFVPDSVAQYIDKYGLYL